MEPQQAYNSWASQYDSNKNKTRDLEAIALRNELNNLAFKSVLEIGCGTGKNTEWFVSNNKNVLALDLSPEMLAKARSKITSEKATFIQADITKPWTFINDRYDLAGFSLVLEHIDDLNFIFSEVSQKIKPGGFVYVGELHPFKQYAGSKARFETKTGTQIVQCFNHNITDFINAAKSHCLDLIKLNEYFDDDYRNNLPRILTLIFTKR
ncbi:MAG: class I SAM-dependent methyltransferase [Ginsengibacter sp.]